MRVIYTHIYIGNIIVDPLSGTDEKTIRFSSAMDYDYTRAIIHTYTILVFICFVPSNFAASRDVIASYPYRTGTIEIRMRITVCYS